MLLTALYHDAVTRYHFLSNTEDKFMWTNHEFLELLAVSIGTFVKQYAAKLDIKWALNQMHHILGSLGTPCHILQEGNVEHSRSAIT